MSAGINQAIETMSNLGTTFVDSYQKGLSMKMGLEENRRKKRKESFAYAKDLSNQYQSYLEKFGEPAAEQFLDHSLNSEQSKFYNIPKNWRPNPTGSALNFTGEEAMKQMLNYLGLEDNEKGREAVNSHLKAQGLTIENTLYFNVFGNNPGKFDSEYSQKKAGVVLDLQTKEASLKKAKKTRKGPENINSLVNVWVNDLNNELETPENALRFKKWVNTIYPEYYEFMNNLSNNDVIKASKVIPVGTNKTRTSEEVNKDIINAERRIAVLERMEKTASNNPTVLAQTKHIAKSVGSALKGQPADTETKLETPKDILNKSIEKQRKLLEELNKELENVNNAQEKKDLSVDDTSIGGVASKGTDLGSGYTLVP